MCNVLHMSNVLKAACVWGYYVVFALSCRRLYFYHWLFIHATIVPTKPLPTTS